MRHGVRCNHTTILIIGASRGLGLAMAADFLQRGWNVVGTGQDSARTELHDLAGDHPDRIEIAVLDVTEPDQRTKPAGWKRGIAAHQRERRLRFVDRD